MTIRHLALMTLAAAAVLLGSQRPARAGYITSLDLTGGWVKTTGSAGPIEGEPPAEPVPVPAAEFGAKMLALAPVGESSPGGMGNSSAGSSHSPTSGAAALLSTVPTLRELQQLRIAHHAERYHPLLLPSRLFRPPRSVA